VIEAVAARWKKRKDDGNAMAAGRKKSEPPRALW
jgi:hypothetical protein